MMCNSSLRASSRAPRHPLHRPRKFPRINSLHCDSCRCRAGMRGKSAKLPSAIAALVLVLLGTPCHSWVPPEPEDLDGIFLLQPGPYTPPFELWQGDSHDHHINITFDESGPFDVNLVLDVISGDADLHVIGPIADADGVPAMNEPLVDVSATTRIGSSRVDVFASIPHAVHA